MEDYRRLTAAVANQASANNFEALLQKYPLLYGYWIKYALSEFQKQNNQQAISIFERAITACKHSCGLWVAYLRFMIETNVTQDEIVSAFLRAEPLVGWQFLSHPFWDLWLEYAKLYKLKFDLEPKTPELAPVEEVLFHILRTKTVHQFSRYFRELKLVTKLDEHHLIDLYTRQQTRVSKVWRYERNLKRPFFHPSPLPLGEVKVWINYIDFIALGEKANLYSRALEIDPYNEQLWLRYIRWLIAEDVDPKDAFELACKLLPASLNDLRLYYALWLEHTGDPSTVSEFYKSLPKTGAIYCQFARYVDRTGGDGDTLLKSIVAGLDDTEAGIVLLELSRNDTEAFENANRNTPAFYKSWIKKQPEKANYIWDLAPAGAIDDEYLTALRRTDIKKYVEMERALNRT